MICIAQPFKMIFGNALIAVTCNISLTMQDPPLPNETWEREQ